MGGTGAPSAESQSSFSPDEAENLVSVVPLQQPGNSVGRSLALRTKTYCPARALISNLGEICSSAPLRICFISDGRVSVSCSMGPIKEFKELLAQHCLMADINEFRTSQTCGGWCCQQDGSLVPGFCDGQLEKVQLKDEAGLSHGPNVVKRCSKCSTVCSIPLPCHEMTGPHSCTSQKS